ncbi:hypothetical protein K144312032_01040 [Clostridium tetani]|uniref:CotS family spore coat protein n=1 Tax=Clostridium tetani TaxID=1513 RepID=UPI002953DB36|nr:CotS family spore coat protein [Clostridium tetani]BDR65876.1 hypothetical protein K144312032_01040 [Clostridium tetani]
MMREFEIERQFDIKIEKLKPNKGVYFLRTNEGTRCLKKINYGIQKLLFVYGAKEHLVKNGFPKVDRYYMNTYGEPFAIVNEDIYTLSEWIDGREADFKNKEDVANAAKSLAHMHIASKGYEPPENSKLKTDLWRWPSLMNKRVRALEKMRHMTRKRNNKNEFEMNYIKNVQFYKDLGIRAINVLESSAYEDLCKISEEDKNFCHHDYTYHNIIIDEDDSINVIDFDYCKREIRAYDISSFMIKVLKRVDWDIEYAKLILESYNKEYPLREEEYRVLFAFLLFPQRFWRLSNRYFYNETNWATKSFDRKMSRLIDEQDAYMKFIENFKTNYDQKE